MAEPDIVLDLWGTDLLTFDEDVSFLYQNTTDLLEASSFRENRLYVSSAGSLHTKSERIHNTLIPASPYYEALRTGGLSACMDNIAALYVADGGTLNEWVAMTLAERCRWIQEYSP